MSKLEHLGTLQEIREEFDKTLVMAQREDKWYFLVGGKKDITNHDIMDSFSMFMKYTIETYMRSGVSGTEAITVMRDYLSQLEASLEECK